LRDQSPPFSPASTAGIAAVVIVIVIIVVIVIVIVVVIVGNVVIAIGNVVIAINNVVIAIEPNRRRDRRPNGDTTGDRDPEIAKNLSGVGIDDDLALALVTAGQDSRPAKQCLFRDNRLESLLSELPDDIVDNILCEGWRSNGQPSNYPEKKPPAVHLMSTPLRI
jgi:hypothetical protein